MSCWEGINWIFHLVVRALCNGCSFELGRPCCIASDPVFQKEAQEEHQ